MKSRAQRIVLGIDPGYGRLGFGVIRCGTKVEALAHGVITTATHGEPASRLREIAADLRVVLTKYRPDLLVLEEIFFAKSTTTALKVAEARGVVMLLAAEAGVPIVNVKPNEVKLAVTGYGRADKRQIQQMVKTIFALASVPRPDDAADALAIAYTGASLLLL